MISARRLALLDTSSLYISATDRDIGMKQKGASMYRFTLSLECVLMTEFSISSCTFYIEKSEFHLWFCTNGSGLLLEA